MNTLDVGAVNGATGHAMRADVSEHHPRTQNATAGDLEGRGQAQPPSDLPGGLEVEDTGDTEGAGDAVVDLEERALVDDVLAGRILNIRPDPDGDL